MMATVVIIDGDELVTLTPRFVQESGVIKSMIEDLDDDEPIPLLGVQKITLLKMMKFLEESSSRSSHYPLKDLFELVTLANFLGMESRVESISRIIGQALKRASTSQTQLIHKVKNEYTKGELEVIRNLKKRL